MPQFLVIARDYTDEKALERRMAAREEHLAKAKIMKQEGSIINGGAILNENGQMCGSAVIMEFENRAALDQWLSQEPYMVQKVWEHVSIEDYRLAAL